MPPYEIESRRLLRAGFLDRGQSLLGVGVTGIEIERESQFFLRFLQFPDAEIHPSEVFVQVCGLRAGAAKLHGLLNLRESLRPVLRVGRREREISELLHAVGDLLVLLQLVVAILILLRFGIIRLFQSACQIVESLRIVGISLQSQFPMGYRVTGISLMLEILAQEELRIGISRLESEELFEELGGAREIVVLLCRKGQKVKRGRVAGIEAYGFLEFLARVLILGGFEKETA